MEESVYIILIGKRGWMMPEKYVDLGYPIYEGMPVFPGLPEVKVELRENFKFKLATIIII